MFWGLLMLGLPLSAIIAAFIYLPFYFYQRKNNVDWLRHAICYTFIGACVLISFATLFLGVRFNLNYGKLNLRPFIWLTEVYDMGFRPMIEQLILNIFMFIPLGILLPIVFKSLRSFWKTVVCSLGITFFIEFIQYFTGRSADIDDLIMNLLGGIIGYGMYWLINHFTEDTLWWKKINAMAIDEVSECKDKVFEVDGI